MANYIIRFARNASIAALFVIAAVLGLLSGVLFTYAGDLPAISALDDYAPSTITRVYASGGEVIGEFATERRVVIGYDDIPERLRLAIVATEDAGFDRHVGLSLTRIVVTAVNDVLKRRRAGASTLTQQLALNLFPPGPDSPFGGLARQRNFLQDIERKIKEAIVAIQIEKRYTKREIFTLYCNHIYFGNGAYGVEAASRLYFGKPAQQVNLEEAALLAAIIQAPERLNPFNDPRRAQARRNYVLQRMAEERFIPAEVATAAARLPIALKPMPTAEDSVAPYFVEEVRKYLESRYGAKALYQDGLSVRTSLDFDLQQAAHRAVTEDLRRLDKRRGFRPPSRNILAEGHRLDSFLHPRWQRPFAADDIVPAVVVDIPAPSARVRIGTVTGSLARDGFAWTGRRSAAELLRRGDVIEVRIKSLDRARQEAVVSLEQTPAPDGALLAIDNRTGQIKAMVGGFSFLRSKFNRATQAYRQTGSAFKPFIYSYAIDRGYTPSYVLMDAPVSYSAGPGQPPYQPQNFDRKFEGPITMRWALEDSRNVPAVRMMAQLGATNVVSYAKRFGFKSEIKPYLSTALGASEATLVEVTSAYSVFPNQGVRMEPYLIQQISNRDGNVLEENRPIPRDAIRADTAFVLTNMLRGVTVRGTAAKAAALNWPIAGKTGTMDEFTDAWFVGFDPNITVGVWIGFDDKKPLGHNMTGSEAALPAWMDFMRAYIEQRGDREHLPRFEPPGNIVFLAVDRSGSPTDGQTPGAISEAYISGTQPGTGFPREP
ncbi:MAG: PBP1A family penicillin-binding protein [Acidobacteria bacterium]|nr:PBP1A family penicillin-binding protein [Acidobacteriota bacterium]